jgi:hypothetical protein
MEPSPVVATTAPSKPQLRQRNQRRWVTFLPVVAGVILILGGTSFAIGYAIQGAIEAYRQALDPFEVADSLCEDLRDPRTAATPEWIACYRGHAAESPWDRAWPHTVRSYAALAVALAGVVVAGKGRRLVWIAAGLLGAAAVAAGLLVYWWIDPQ